MGLIAKRLNLFYMLLSHISGSSLMYLLYTFFYVFVFYAFEYLLCLKEFRLFLFRETEKAFFSSKYKRNDILAFCTSKYPKLHHAVLLLRLFQKYFYFVFIYIYFNLYYTSLTYEIFRWITMFYLCVKREIVKLNK